MFGRRTRLVRHVGGISGSAALAVAFSPELARPAADLVALLGPLRRLAAQPCSGFFAFNSRGVLFRDADETGVRQIVPVDRLPRVRRDRGDTASLASGRKAGGEPSAFYWLSPLAAFAVAALRIMVFSPVASRFLQRRDAPLRCEAIG